MSLGSYRERSKFIKKIIFWSMVVVGLLGLLFIQTKVPSFAAAPADPCVLIGGCTDGIDAFKPTDSSDSATNLINLILTIARIMVYVGGAVSVFFMVISGYRMITSNGEEKNYKAGREGLLYATLGLAAAILSFTIVALIGSIVGSSSIVI